MLTTPLTTLTGAKYPLIGGTMMDISRGPWVATVSEAGAVGMLASAIYLDENDFRDDLKLIRDRTDQPFGVNINLFPMMRKLNNLRYLDIMAEEGVKLVETSGYAPPKDVAAHIKQHGMTWMHKCVGVRYAEKAESMGADAVTVVGYENGGATGNMNITTLVLVPATVDALKIPVIAGGGIVDGRTFVAALALGAAGAILGTRLMLSTECPLHDNLKKALLEASELDTDIVMRSVGFAHRIWMNEPAKKAQELENQGAPIEKIYPFVSGEAAHKMFETGDLAAGTISCSQAVGLVRDIKPVKEIITELMESAAALGKRLGATLGAETR